VASSAIASDNPHLQVLLLLCAGSLNSIIIQTGFKNENTTNCILYCLNDAFCSVDHTNRMTSLISDTVTTLFCVACDDRARFLVNYL
jgi:hypothetical protein